MNNNHTPGPWRVGDGSWVTADQPVPEINGSDHLEFYGGHLIAESIAPQNLTLIAAAPDLLEAAKSVEAWWLSQGKESFDGAPAAVFAVRAAIAKATEEEKP